MWETEKRQYSDLENSAQLFELRNKARNLTQGERDVTTYFNALTKLWQEIDLFNNANWLCSEDAYLPLNPYQVLMIFFLRFAEKKLANV